MYRINQNKVFLDFRHKISAWPWIPIIMGAGIAIRLSGLTTGPMWYDEIFSLTATRLNLFEMIGAIQSNLNPPGWEIILWFVTRIFGRGILSSHLPRPSAHAA